MKDREALIAEAEARVAERHAAAARLASARRQLDEIAQWQADQERHERERILNQRDKNVAELAELQRYFDRYRTPIERQAHREYEALKRADREWAERQQRAELAKLPRMWWE